ncbi:hypothetical protein OKA04_06980 [Luteolibacter flavescens]|uniref:Uncharacterized protein n=1 Tax=Luteolibacter flavescens TaxID=1859460 RepID=A0ABT3FLM1_9BACT|nr:hypothetical protein [Luteolibacter flavescens]MCW1884469.1 hypothetical protein [Luteolibacter flavescens]
MTRSRLLLIAAIIPVALAQDIAPKDSEIDPVISALTEDMGDEPVREGITATSPAHPSGEDGPPVLITGTPPEGAEIENAPPPIPEPEGVTVQVEPGKGGAGKVNSSAVKLLAPFPAKPLSQPPAGWRLEHPEDIPSFTQEVLLENGTRIPLSIRPHLLVPDADGENVIGVNEPGFDPALRYAQAGTMSAVLANSVERMEEDSRELGNALDRLGQLLGSLPKTEEPAPAPKEVTTPDKKKR